MDATYKVGDKVMVKSKLDKGYGFIDYRFGFIDTMLKTFGGEVVTISKVSPKESIAKRMPDDMFEYRIKEDNRRFMWASSMFEPEF